MKTQMLFTALAAIGFAGALDANAVTITFQENDSPVNTSTVLGTSATFTEGVASITATGYSSNNNLTDLFAKYTSGDPTETGLGLNNDPDKEIHGSSFIQLTVPPSPAGSTLDVVLTGSIQTGETSNIGFSTTAGTRGALIPGGSQSGGGTFSFTVPSGDQSGYIDIWASSGNVLLDSVTITVPSVPDGGLTIAMLGAALTVLGLARRKLIA